MILICIWGVGSRVYSIASFVVYMFAEPCGSPYLFMSFQVKERKLSRASPIGLEPKIRLCIEMSQLHDLGCCFEGGVKDSFCS